MTLRSERFCRFYLSTTKSGRNVVEFSAYDFFTVLKATVTAALRLLPFTLSRGW
jgi:hypothetical protein